MYTIKIKKKKKIINYLCFASLQGTPAGVLEPFTIIFLLVDDGVWVEVSGLPVDRTVPSSIVICIQLLGLVLLCLILTVKKFKS